MLTHTLGKVLLIASKARNHRLWTGLSAKSLELSTTSCCFSGPPPPAAAAAAAAAPEEAALRARD